MKMPDRYREVFAGLPKSEVSFGSGGIKLFSASEFEGGQVGYSVAPDGKPLCGDETGAWQSNWIVVGYETGCGDPLFIDTGASELPVFTAMHGEGAWVPVEVAISVKAFAKCVEEFSRISVGRSNPAEHEANPVGDEERVAFLHSIAQANQTNDAPEFWEVLLES